MSSSSRSRSRERAAASAHSYFSRVKHSLENQEEPIKDVAFDPCDERFLAPALLHRDGSLNLELLFGNSGSSATSGANLSAADRRYVLRQMEKCRESFLDRILDTTRRKQEEERRRLEEAEDTREMRQAAERFAAIKARLKQKEQVMQESVQTKEEQAAQEEKNRLREQEQKFWDSERQRVRELERQAAEEVPDFPTTFARCSRLHMSPVRQRVAAETPTTAATSSASSHTPPPPRRSPVSAASPSSLVSVNFVLSKNGILLPNTEPNSL